jgi:transcription-repair coupling factor (superfamily II helicase)
MRDLEIRGAGNLLGAEQSGHIAAVGYEMYCQLLEQAVRRLREGTKEPRIESMIDLGSSGTIPEAYIASPSRRLAMYCRFAQCETQQQLNQIVHDLTTGYGDIPQAVERLVKFHELRVAASSVGIASMTIDDDDIVIRTKNVDGIQKQLQATGGTMRTVGVPSVTGLITLYYRSKLPLSSEQLLSEIHSSLVESSTLS